MRRRHIRPLHKFVHIFLYLIYSYQVNNSLGLQEQSSVHKSIKIIKTDSIAESSASHSSALFRSSALSSRRFKASSSLTRRSAVAAAIPFFLGPQNAWRRSSQTFQASAKCGTKLSHTAPTSQSRNRGWIAGPLLFSPPFGHFGSFQI